MPFFANDTIIKTKREKEKIKMKEKIRNTGQKLLTGITTFVTLCIAKTNYIMSTTDAFDQAGTAVDNLKGKLITFGGKVFPLALVVTIVCMFFTRDQKKFDIERTILIGLCVTYALLILVSKGAVVSTITNLFGATAAAG